MPDVNVLVGAFRRDIRGHDLLRSWLENAVSSGEGVAVTPAVAGGTVRVLTHPRVFARPDSPDTALAHLAGLLAHPRVTMLGPGPAHWQLVARLCRDADARGNLVTDAAHAAVAIEHDAIWVTQDRDFARFAGLRWETPDAG